MFKRDYLKLSDVELEAKSKFDDVGKGQMIRTPEHFEEKSKITAKYPAIRYYNSLFPNYLLNHEELKNKNDELNDKLNDFRKVIDDKNSTERNVLNFIRESEAYFIIGSLAIDYSNWGHHDLYIFPEFPLGTEYKVDYLLAGENSFGFHFMFIELENVFNSITNQKGDFGTAIRKGISQVNDWEKWLEKNFNHLKPIYEKMKNQNEQLPCEFYEFDKTKISYAVIGGRRNDYNKTTYRLRGKLRDDSKINVLHYDNLVDCSSKILKYKAY